MPFSTGNQVLPTQVDTGSSGNELLFGQLLARDEELLARMLEFGGPSSVIGGSAVAFEGDVTIAANQSLSGLHYYNNLTINSGITVTADEPLIIVFNGTMDMQGATIDADGQGGLGGTGASEKGQDGCIASGGSAGGGVSLGGDGGDSRPSLALTPGGVCTGLSAGADGTPLPAFQIAAILMNAFGLTRGGAGGGASVSPSTSGTVPGKGGGIVIIIGPNFIGTGGTVTANGTDGTGADGSPQDVGPGGGGGGLAYLKVKSYVPLAVLSTAGGLGAPVDANTVYAGGNGAEGVKQVSRYG